MARGCDVMADNQEHENRDYEVPVIQLNNGLDVGTDDANEDDDDAAVYLQELGLNYGITARSKGRSSLLQSLVSREGSAVSSGMTSMISRQKSSRTLVEVTNRVTQGGEGQLYRLLSAKRNHVQQLNSDINFLHKRIKELEEQNRLLVRLGKRQEAALCRYQDMKSELPHIIENHKIEIIVLQEKLRRSTEVNRRNNDKLKVTDGRIIKLTEELSRLRELSKKRNLPERDQLNKKLSAAAQSLQEKEKEAEELQRRSAIIEKSLKQQVQAEVGRHRSTAKKLYKLQCEHHHLQDILKDRERELATLQQYSRRVGRTPGGSSTTTAASSRSGSVTRHKSGRNRSSGSSGTTSGIVSSVEITSTSESRASMAHETGGRLPPISADPRKRNECQITSIMSVSPEPSEVPTRRARHRGHLPGKINRDCTEDRRTGRLRRGRRSPRHSTDDDYLHSPRCTPTPSPPSSTPEPQIQQQSESNGDATDGSGNLPDHTDYRRRQRHAVNSQEARRKGSLEGNEGEESSSREMNENMRPTVNREYSLIEHHPPRERIVLTGGSSGGSDSGSGVSPPPIKPVFENRVASRPVCENRVASRLSRLDSPQIPCHGPQLRHNTINASDLRTVSSLSELIPNDSHPKPIRAAITP